MLAEAMKFTDHSEVELERLKAERAAEKKRQGADVDVAQGAGGFGAGGFGA
jgi:hypothetical protein